MSAGKTTILSVAVERRDRGHDIFEVLDEVQVNDEDRTCKIYSFAKAGRHVKLNGGRRVRVNRLTPIKPHR